MEKSRLDTLRDMLDNDPGDSFTLYAIGLEYMSLKDTQKASEIFEELKIKAPEYLPLYYQLGQAYEMLGQTEKARTVYQEGIELAAKSKEIHTMDELQQALEQLY